MREFNNNYNIFYSFFYISDYWKPNMGMKDLPEEYFHDMVNPSKEFKTIDGTFTYTIKGSWLHPKRSLPLSVW